MSCSEKSVRKRWYLRSSFPETDTEMRFCVQKNVLDSRREHSNISDALGLSPKGKGSGLSYSGILSHWLGATLGPCKFQGSPSVWAEWSPGVQGTVLYGRAAGITS